MSSYIHFFIEQNSNFIELFSFSRSSEIYEAFENYAPYEKVTALNESVLNEVEADYEHYISCVEKSVAQYRESLALVPSFQNSVEEKIEAMNSIQQNISESQLSIAGYEEVQNFIKIFKTIIYNGAYSSNPPKLYFGIEVGSKISSEMII